MIDRKSEGRMRAMIEKKERERETITRALRERQCEWNGFHLLESRGQLRECDYRTMQELQASIAAFEMQRSQATAAILALEWALDGQCEDDSEEN